MGEGKIVNGVQVSQRWGRSNIAHTCSVDPAGNTAPVAIEAAAGVTASISIMILMIISTTPSTEREVFQTVGIRLVLDEVGVIAFPFGAI